MTPGGDVTILHHFSQAPHDGWWPHGALIQASDGALYGATISGGTYNRGTIYRVTLSGTFTVLHSFGEPGSQGNRPHGRLLEASDGNFYGATIGGGTSDCGQYGEDCGTIFKLTPAGQHSVIYEFGVDPANGVVPNGSLTEGSDGSLYGTTRVAGNDACSAFEQIAGCGTLFRLTKSGQISTLHTFSGEPDDGAVPYGPVSIGPDGAMYGTTYFGGGGVCLAWASCGTVFRLDGEGDLEIIHAFAVPGEDGTGTQDEGYHPMPYLTVGSDGNLYGTTESGGLLATERTGVIFRMTTGGDLTVLYRFGLLSEEPSYPAGGVVQGSDGAFYGTTFYNGKLGAVGPRAGQGAAYRLTVE